MSELRHRSSARAHPEDCEDESTTAKIVKSLKQLDVYPKTEEENISVQTHTGGLITLITLAFVSLLFVSELWRYLSVDVQHSIAVDTQSNKKLDITFNISFPSLQCSKAGIDLMDMSGEAQTSSLRQVWKTRLAPLTMKHIGVPFQDLHEEGENEEQDHEHARDVRHSDMFREGCNLAGTLTVNKVAGNFHMAIGASHSANPHQRHVHGFSIDDMMQFNSSHIIHELRFGPNLGIKGLIHPLERASQILTKGSPAAHFQYFIKVVPTLYTNTRGQVVETNHYSVTNHSQVLGSLDMFRGDGRRIPGVFFVYDISPFLLHIKEKSMRFTEFFISCCAIVGGIVSIAGIVDSVIHYIAKFQSQTD